MAISYLTLISIVGLKSVCAQGKYTLLWITCWRSYQSNSSTLKLPGILKYQSMELHFKWAPCPFCCVLHIFPEWIEFQGSEYLFSSDMRNWTSAQSECERLAANLTSITSQQEQDFIIEQIKWVQIPISVACRGFVILVVCAQTESRQRSAHKYVYIQ